MGKIICDVCGTAYAETVSQCPICGCASSAAASKVITVGTEDGAKDNGSYTYVKGGRFSKANVNKRNKARHSEPYVPVNETRQEKRTRLNKEREQKNNKGLVITVIVLLLAIIAVVCYIVLRFFAPLGTVAEPDTQVQKPTADQTPAVISCVEIKLSAESVTLDAKGAVMLLDVQLTPADTTDSVEFMSEDPAVATVDDNGKIVAVAHGETVIRVTCGSAAATYKVVCGFEDETQPTQPTVTEPVVTEPVPTEPTSPEEEFKFNTVFANEMTLKAGTTFGLRLQDSNKKSVDAVFTSSKTSVCTVDEDGTVRAVAPGRATIKAEYQGKVYNCTVHVN